MTGVKYILLGEGCRWGALRRALAQEGEMPWFDYRIHFADVFASGCFDLVMCGLASNMPGPADLPWIGAGSLKTNVPILLVGTLLLCDWQVGAKVDGQLG